MTTIPFTLWRLYTENRSNLSHIVRAHFDNATIIATTGIKHGREEPGAIIEILAEDFGFGRAGYIAERIEALKTDICYANNQTEVFVVQIPVNTGQCAVEITDVVELGRDEVDRDININRYGSFGNEDDGE